MPSTAPCVICGKEGRNGKARKGKYCDDHIPEGILAGSINSKRGRPVSPAGSSSSQGSKPDRWKLLSIEKIYDCRYVPHSLPTLLLASNSHVIG
jgi:hypothetical protein